MSAETPIRRTLALIVRSDSLVRVMYTASRGDCVTKRESWGLARTNSEMSTILAQHPIVAALDFVLPRIQTGRRRVSLLRDSIERELPDTAQSEVFTETRCR